MTFLDGWGDIPDAPEPTPLANGDLDGITEALDPVALVGLIAGNPAAMAALAAALEPEGKKDPLYRFATVDEWVQEYVLANWRYRLQGDRVLWCESWALHTQAATELDMLWHSWESHRRVPSSLAQWLVHLFHPTMDRLLSPDTSPFDGCTHSGNGRDAVHQPSQVQLPAQLFPGVFPRYPTQADPDPQQ